MENKQKKNPGIAVLDEFMETKLSTKQIEQISGIPSRELLDIFSGVKKIDVDVAIALQTAFGKPAHYWMELQDNFDK